MTKLLPMALLCLILISSIQAQDDSGGKLSGQMFGDYFYNILRDSMISDIPNTALSGKKDLNGFQFRRIYFTYDYKISDKFSTRFRLESQTQAGVDNTLFVVFIKDAYLQWKEVFDGSNLIFGIQPPPTFTVSVTFWRYRSLERTSMDLRKVASSRDFGLSLKGKLVTSGKINYWVMFANGSTFESEGDKYKRAYAHLDFLPSENFRITVNGDYRFNPEKNYYGKSYNNDALLTSLFLGYAEKGKFSLGLETFLQMNNNDINSVDNYLSVSNRNALGISVFGSYSFTETLAGVLRYDYFDNNISADFKGDSRNFFLAGLDFKLHKNVSIIPNFEFESYETTVNGLSIDPSLTARITFYYGFL